MKRKECAKARWNLVAFIAAQKCSEGEAAQIAGSFIEAGLTNAGTDVDHNAAGIARSSTDGGTGRAPLLSLLDDHFSLSHSASHQHHPNPLHQDVHTTSSVASPFDPLKNGRPMSETANP